MQGAVRPSGMEYEWEFSLVVNLMIAFTKALMFIAQLFIILFIYIHMSNIYFTGEARKI